MDGEPKRIDRSFSLRERMAYMTAMAVVLAGLVSFEIVPNLLPKWVELILIFLSLALVVSLGALLGIGVGFLVGGRRRVMVAGIVASILFPILLFAYFSVVVLITKN